LLTYGLDQYRAVSIVDGSRVYGTIPTGYGQPDVELVAPRAISRSIRAGRPLVERVVAPTSLSLPVEKGARLGHVEVYDGTRLVGASPLVAAAGVADASFFAKVKWYATRTVHNLWSLVT
jgi:D-alanyl-D-alanine carboxypeptidase